VKKFSSSSSSSFCFRVRGATKVGAPPRCGHYARAPRRIAYEIHWKGHIRFLLVAIPVSRSIRDRNAEKIQFNQLHREDYGPNRVDKRCKKCQQVVSKRSDHQRLSVRAGRYAIIEPEDIAKVKIKTTKAVDIIGFVGSEEIPGRFTIRLTTRADGPVSEKPYACCAKVMSKTGKVADRQSRAARSRRPGGSFSMENGLVLQKLHYPHELRSMKDVPELNGAKKLDKERVESLATTLVGRWWTSLSEIDTAVNITKL